MPADADGASRRPSPALGGFGAAFVLLGASGVAAAPDPDPIWAVVALLAGTGVSGLWALIAR